MRAGGAVAGEPDVGCRLDPVSNPVCGRVSRFVRAREGVSVDLDLRERCAALVDRSGSTQPFGLHVVASTDPAAELGRVVERVVFEEFFDNSPELLDEEYEPYEPASMFLCVIDQRRLVPAGVMRLIVPSPAGLKTLDDIERVLGRACRRRDRTVGHRD